MNCTFQLRIFKLTPRWNTLHLTFKITVESLKTLWGICGLLITLGAYFSLVGMTEFGQSYLSEWMDWYKRFMYIDIK